MDTKEGMYSWEDCKKYCEDISKGIHHPFYWKINISDDQKPWDILHSVLVQAHEGMRELDKALLTLEWDVKSARNTLKVSQGAAETREQILETQTQLIEVLKKRIVHLKKQSQISDLLGEYSLTDSVEIAGEVVEALLRHNQENRYEQELRFIRQIQKLFIILCK